MFFVLVGRSFTLPFLGSVGFMASLGFMECLHNVLERFDGGFAIFGSK